MSLEAVKQWLSDMQKGCYVLGPLLPRGYGIETQNGEEGASVDIETFLGEMQLQHGKGSVFFVGVFSFFRIPTGIQLNKYSSDLLWHYLLSLSFGICR